MLQVKMQSTNPKTETAPPSDQRWQVVHDVSYEIDRNYFWHVIRNERILRAILDSVSNPEDLNCLEIGCGVGNVLGYWHEKGFKNCSGWEINEHALEIAKLRYPQISFEQRDFLLPLQTESQFDIVGLFDTLEHFESDLQIALQLRELVRPGGLAVITVPAMMSLWGSFDEYYGHYRRYEKQGLIKLLESAGFSEPKATYFMAPLSLAKRARKGDSRGTDDEMSARFVRDCHLPSALNELLKFVLRMEHRLLGKSDLGFGASLIATAKRPPLT